MINPWYIVGLLVGVITLTSTAYNYGYNNGVNKVEAAQTRDNDLIAKVEERAMLGAANEIAKIQLKQTTIYNKVQKEVQTNTVYRECKHTADGLRSINEALTNSKTESIDTSKLPYVNNP
jgi:hypothetical protein